MGLAGRVGRAFEGIIERGFRFIEMIIIASLIGVAMRVVFPVASEWVAYGLSLAAGVYIGIPIARWIRSNARRPSDNPLSELLVLVLGSVAIGGMAVSMTYGLQILISASFQINEGAARNSYQLWQAQSRLEGCDGSPRGPQPPPENEIRECEARWNSEILRLQAERRALPGP